MVMIAVLVEKLLNKATSAINAPGDKCSYQDLSISQKTVICLQGRKSHDILYVEIDYFINRLIEIQAVSSLPGYTSHL